MTPVPEAFDGVRELDGAYLEHAGPASRWRSTTSTVWPKPSTW